MWWRCQEKVAKLDGQTGGWGSQRPFVLAQNAHNILLKLPRWQQAQLHFSPTALPLPTPPRDSSYFDPSAALEVTNVGSGQVAFFSRGVNKNVEILLHYASLGFFFMWYPPLTFYPMAMRYYGYPLHPASISQLGNCKVINYIAHRVIVSMPQPTPSSSRISF